MGLNLNIRRVVFHTTIKRERGKKTYWVDPSSVKQIGGRAWRLSSNYKEGEVTSWQEADLAYIRGVMSWEIPPIPAAGIFPSVEQVEVFWQQMQKASEAAAEEGATAAAGEDDWKTEGDEGEEAVSSGSVVSTSDATAVALLTTLSNSLSATITSATTSTTTTTTTTTTPTPSPPRLPNSNPRLAYLLERFVELARMDGRYFLCDHQDMVVVSNWLHSIPLTLAERFTFANAPVSLRDNLATGILYQFAAAYAVRRPVALNVRLSRQKPRDILEFSDLCLKHNILDLYLWLSLRYPEYFVEQDLCQDQKAHAISMIEGSLDLPSLQQKFSHSRDYQTVRQNMHADTDSDALPPLEFGDVRQSTRENLAKIEADQMYIFPHIREEEAVADRAGGGARGHYQGDKKGYRTSPNPPRSGAPRVDKRAIV